MTTFLRRRGQALALTGVLVGALLLRLWGIKWGLPFTYNVDERAHFVPKAVGFFGGDLNPHYQLNPPGFSYLLAAVYAVWFHSADAVRSTYAEEPTTAFLVARVTSAVLGTASVALVYLAGARLLGRWAGLLAAALLAVAFLPVFYAHQAVNDAPTLAPVALSLFGAALALRRGRIVDYALAGLGAGLAAGFKYNAGLVVLALAGAAVVRFADGERRAAVVRLAVSAAAAIAGFLLTNPYAVLDYATFDHAIDYLVTYNARGPLVGERETSGHLYYLWTLTWGLGWVPLALAVGGGALLLARDRRAAIVLIPTAVVFFAYMGSQGRFFGRYMLPVFPLLCLLAGWAGVQLVELVRARWGRLGLPAAVLVAVAALGQGLVYTVHNDVVLAREDTRSQARRWMVENLPPGTRIVVEPTVPRSWYRDGGLPEFDRSKERWRRWGRTRALVRLLARQYPGASKKADFQNYVSTLFPGLLGVYRSAGACWYVASSTQAGRAFREPDRVPQALAFYRTLEREADVAFRATPFAGRERAFQFDLSFNYEPLAYRRPGPVITVYRLRGCG